MKTARIGLVATMAVLILAGFNSWPGAGDRVDDAPVETARVGRAALEETVLATGVIRPVVGAEVNVGSRISGTVLRLPVEIGDQVKVGQLLAELDRQSLEAATDQVRADVAVSRSRKALARSTLERRRLLADKGLASAEDLDRAIQDLDVTIAQLAASKARLRAAEINLGYTRITAPIKGVVAEVTTREGETVAADFSAPTFVTILDLDRLEVLAYVDETDIGRIYVGQAASFSVDTYPDMAFTAVVTTIQPRAEIQGSVVNYVVRLEFDPGVDHTLRPEMTAHVQLVVEQRDEVLTAPRRALRRRDGRQYVLVQRNGQWVEQSVRTGWRSESAIEILGGVQEHDLVAINPE